MVTSVSKKTRWWRPKSKLKASKLLRPQSLVLSSPYLQLQSSGVPETSLANTCILSLTHKHTHTHSSTSLIPSPGPVLSSDFSTRPQILTSGGLDKRETHWAHQPICETKGRLKHIIYLIHNEGKPDGSQRRTDTKITALRGGRHGVLHICHVTEKARLYPLMNALFMQGSYIDSIGKLRHILSIFKIFQHLKAVGKLQIIMQYILRVYAGHLK